jgi:hypothetical protein
VEIVPMLMQGNARDLFGLDEKGRLRTSSTAVLPS